MAVNHHCCPLFVVLFWWKGKACAQILFTAKRTNPPILGRGLGTPLIDCCIITKNGGQRTVPFCLFSPNNRCALIILNFWVSKNKCSFNGYFMPVLQMHYGLNDLGPDLISPIRRVVGTWLLSTPCMTSVHFMFLDHGFYAN